MKKNKFTLMKSMVLIALIILSSTALASTEGVSSSAFTWWQNHILDLIIQDSSNNNQTTFESADLANITVVINNTDSQTLNTSYFTGALLIEIKNTTGVVKTFSIGTNVFVNNSTTGYYNYTNDFSGLSNGDYNVSARFIYSYPSQNLTLTDQNQQPVNTTANITIEEASTSCGDGICNGIETCSSCPADCGTCGSGSGGSGGGGRGGGIVFYSAELDPEKPTIGDTVKIILKIENDKPTQDITGVKIFMLKDYQIIEQIEENITTSSKQETKKTYELLDILCSTDEGDYQIKVEFYSGRFKRKTEDFSFKLLPCREALVLLTTTKTVYFPGELMKASFILNNTGNIDLFGDINIYLNPGDIQLVNIESITLEKGTGYSGSFSSNLNVPANSYYLTLNYTGEEFSFKTEKTIIVSEELATAVNIVAWVIILLTLILVLIAVIKTYNEGRRYLVEGQGWRYKGL